MADEKKDLINFTDKVKVKATDKHPFEGKGKEFEVHPNLAKDFLAQGYIEKYEKATA